MTTFKEQDSEKVAEFLDILDNLNDLPVVYIWQTAASIVLMHELLEGRKSMKRLSDGVLSGL